MLSEVELPELAGLPSLPPDIVRCIAEQLQDDSFALLSMCLLNTQCFDLILPLLYSQISLGTPDSIGSFCDTITHLNQNLGIYTHALHIDPISPSSEYLDHLVTPIHLVLRRLPNLTSLVLHIDTINTISLYYTFHLNPPPFSLRFFSGYASTSTYLLEFLSTQPTITHLTLYDARLALRPPGIRFIQPTQLPNLTYIHANPITIHAFVPGRPITHVHSGTMLLFNATVYWFCEALRGSNAREGVEDVSVCIAKTKFWTGASDFITRLTGVCGSSLKRLKLRMPDLRVWALDLGSYAVLVEVLAESIVGFTRLERFQFDGEEANIPSVVLIEDLGNVGTLSFWKKRCPSLDSVTLFGVDLS